MLVPSVALIPAIDIEALALGQAADCLNDVHRALKSSSSHTLAVRMLEGCCVVIARPTGMGNVNSALRVAQVLHDHPSVKQVIMCGIGGVVRSGQAGPGLGDVVYSGPQGVVEFDLVYRRSTGHELRQEDFLRPGQGLVDAAGVAAKTPISAVDVDIAAREVERLRIGDGGLDKSVLLRAPPNEGSVSVHEGLIASGNVLLRDAAFRGDLHRRLGASAVDMESAGVAKAALMGNRATYLAIRGITDHCDHRKDDAWHGRAAVAAAMFALKVVRALDVSLGASRPSYGRAAVAMFAVRVMRALHINPGAPKPCVVPSSSGWVRGRVVDVQSQRRRAVFEELENRRLHRFPELAAAAIVRLTPRRGRSMSPTELDASLQAPPTSYSQARAEAIAARSFEAHPSLRDCLAHVATLGMERRPQLSAALQLGGLLPVLDPVSLAAAGGVQPPPGATWSEVALSSPVGGVEDHRRSFDGALPGPIAWLALLTLQVRLMDVLPPRELEDGGQEWWTRRIELAAAALLELDGRPPSNADNLRAAANLLQADPTGEEHRLLSQALMAPRPARREPLEAYVLLKNAFLAAYRGFQRPRRARGHSTSRSAARRERAREAWLSEASMVASSGEPTTLYMPYEVGRAAWLGRGAADWLPLGNRRWVAQLDVRDDAEVERARFTIDVLNPEHWARHGPGLPAPVGVELRCSQLVLVRVGWLRALRMHLKVAVPEAFVSVHANQWPEDHFEGLRQISRLLEVLEAHDRLTDPIPLIKNPYWEEPPSPDRGLAAYLGCELLEHVRAAGGVWGARLGGTLTGPWEDEAADLVQVLQAALLRAMKNKGIALQLCPSDVRRLYRETVYGPLLHLARLTSDELRPRVLLGSGAAGVHLTSAPNERARLVATALRVDGEEAARELEEWLGKLP